MPFQLDLAIAYVLSITLLFWISTFAVPALFRALTHSIAAWIRSHRSPTPQRVASHQDWWGPTHHSH